MGWSYSAVAGRVMDALTKACRASTGSVNTWKRSRGESFWETDRIEQDDGSITGDVWDCLGAGGTAVGGTCVNRREFRIDGRTGKLTGDAAPALRALLMRGAA